MSKRELSETMEYIANYSMYAYEEELRQGFLTIRGGHRVGVSGKAVVEQGRIRSIKDISFLNVRISHEVRGCANPVMSCLAGDGEVRHTLIISPPGCGKTTLLRDIIRQISDGGIHGRGRTVGVVDERSEIGGAYQGIPQNDLGIRTDLLDACPKAEGMMMLIRSMAPEVLAVDEIGSEEDIHALRSAINCGCRILATVHGNSLRDVCRKPLFHRMTDEKLFERYIILNHHGRAGNIARILDENGEALRERREAYA